MQATEKPVRSKWKIILPLVVLLFSIGLTALMVALKPEQEKKEHLPNHPKVEVFSVREEPVKVVVHAQGTVRPRQQTTLTARVSGHIEWVSPSFYEGGSFKEGDILLQLDPLPYESALAEARSRHALAQSAYLQEQEAAEQAQRDWQQVGQGEPSPLVLRQPQLEKAKADLEASTVAVRMAEENLSYTGIRAPYAGRVQAKYVDVGRAITAQATALADIFSTEAMEVPMAISLDDLAFISNNPESTNPGNSGSDKTRILLNCEIAGQLHHWEAYLDRTAASIDERTRMITAYARMDPPFLSDHGTDLKPGMFVDSAIEGRTIESAVRIPRGALQPGGIVYRLDPENHLEAIRLEVIRADSNWAIIDDGLQPGDRICLTPLLVFVNGMRVEPVEEAGTPLPELTEPTP